MNLMCLSKHIIHGQAALIMDQKWLWKLRQVLGACCTLYLFIYFSLPTLLPTLQSNKTKWNKNKNQKTKANGSKTNEPLHPYCKCYKQQGELVWKSKGKRVCQDHTKSNWTYFFTMKHGDVSCVVPYVVCPWGFFLSLAWICSVYHAIVTICISPLPQYVPVPCHLPNFLKNSLIRSVKVCEYVSNCEICGVSLREGLVMLFNFEHMKSQTEHEFCVLFWK